MCQDPVEVRAATLRTLRYLISSDSEVHDFITINGHFLLARCLDIELDNKVKSHFPGSIKVGAYLSEAPFSCSTLW